MENRDVDTPEQEPNIVADIPPVASSKKKKVILVGCGFCVLLFLICAGIGLPMVANFRRNVKQAVEVIEAANEIEKQRLEEQYEMPEAEESGSIDDGNTSVNDDRETFAEFMAETSDLEGSSGDEQPDEAEQPTKPVTADPPVVELPSITNTIGMKFNNIPAGTFMMGSPESEEDRDEDEHQHQVTISKAFYMQTTEVTQGQWQALMGTEPWKGEDYVKEGTNYAATQVSWHDAIAYCKKLSEKEGKTYRLPTEAEWEYACRAGTKTTWSFGNDKEAHSDHAWWQENADDIGERYAHQVGQKKSNAFGLYDMHGNVWEWCNDCYGPDYYKQLPKKDPTGPETQRNTWRVLRGGSWLNLWLFTRSASRDRNYPQQRRHHYGFRLVRELD
ncbi:MAG: formylglycine-generating enzyme family protein [Dehalococcoidia bacterium]|nr:formylglycine-generating enzyme family protein [Dehalococcoidia bacterium]